MDNPPYSKRGVQGGFAVLCLPQWGLPPTDPLLCSSRISETPYWGNKLKSVNLYSKEISICFRSFQYVHSHLPFRLQRQVNDITICLRPIIFGDHISERCDKYMSCNYRFTRHKAMSFAARLRSDI